MKNFLVLVLALLFSISSLSQEIGSQRAKYDLNLPTKLNKPAGTPLDAGTYSVGTGGYFATIQEAFNKLSSDGIAGSVTLELIDDLYTAPTDSFGFKLVGPIVGASPTHRVTIKPAVSKNVVIQGNGFMVLSMWNVSYLSYDGVSISGSTTLKIHSLFNSSYPWNDALDFIDNSDHNIIQNISVISEDISRYGLGIGVWTFTPSLLTADSNLVQNNLIKKGGLAVYVSAYSSIRLAKGNIVKNNFVGSETDSLICWGIQVEKNENAIVEDNTVQNLKYSNGYLSNDNYGINIYYGVQCTVRNNIVHNINLKAGTTCAGILLSGEYGSNGTVNLVYNNMVYDIRGSSTAAGASVGGITFWWQNAPMIYFNTIHLSGRGNGANSGGSYAIGIWSNVFNAIIKNNILVNLRDESPYLSSSIFSYSSITTSDYNNLYVLPGSNNCLLYSNGTKFKTLSTWQSFGKDLHSISEQPTFRRDLLHIEEIIPNYIESAGTPITGINTDFDGDLRNITNPDIGADEFDGIIKDPPALIVTPAIIDFGNMNIGQTSNNIEVNVKNQRAETITINSITSGLNEFKITDLPTLPYSIASNDSFIFKVNFTPLDYGTYDDLLEIASSDWIQPVTTIALKGNVFFLGSEFQKFYDKVVTAGTPQQKNAIVDSFLIAHPVMPFIEDSIAHFIYRGYANVINLSCDANDWATGVWPLNKFTGIDFWFISKTFEMDARIDYKFILNETNWILDPRNPRTCTGGFGPNSELAMPEYVDPPEILSYNNIPHGTKFDTTITSTVLGNSRSIRVYMPPGYNSQGTERYGVVLFHDGGEYVNLGKAMNILDYLISEKRIQPIITVFVPPVERENEYATNKTLQYESFIVDELMSYIDSKYKTKTEGNQRAMVGPSYGGLITTQICYNRPEAFGLAAPYSPSYWAKNMEVYNSVLNGEKKDIKWYIDWGTYEPSIMINGITFKDGLINKGYDVIWKQWHEGHSWGSWKAHLDIALEYFFPGEAVTVEEDISIPVAFNLSQNYPNPFNPVTKIKYSIPELSRVIIKVYDILGNEIAILVNEEKQIGNYEFNWNAASLASGVYIYQIKAGSFVQTRKMILLK
jgi:enterochelin esterase family protein